VSDTKYPYYPEMPELETVCNNCGAFIYRDESFKVMHFHYDSDCYETVMLCMPCHLAWQHGELQCP